MDIIPVHAEDHGQRTDVGTNVELGDGLLPHNLLVTDPSGPVSIPIYS